jgi:hypothetical protein
MAFFANCEETQVRIAIIAVSDGSCSSNLTGLIAAGPYRTRGSLRRNHGPEVVTEARWAHPVEESRRLTGGGGVALPPSVCCCRAHMRIGSDCRVRWNVCWRRSDQALGRSEQSAVVRAGSHSAALAKGETDAQRLAQLGAERLQCTNEQRVDALTGKVHPKISFCPRNPRGLRSHLSRCQCMGHDGPSFRSVRLLTGRLTRG